MRFRQKDRKINHKIPAAFRHVTRKHRIGWPAFERSYVEFLWLWAAVLSCSFLGFSGFWSDEEDFSLFARGDVMLVLVLASSWSEIFMLKSRSVYISGKKLEEKRKKETSAILKFCRMIIYYRNLKKRKFGIWNKYLLFFLTIRKK